MGILVFILVFALTGFGCGEKDTPVEVVKEPELIESFQGPQLKPVRLVISKIGIDEKIEAVGKDENDDMEGPPGPIGISWFQSDDGTFPSPGWTGNALITGHNYFNLVAGTFVDLHKLEIGDTAEFTYEDGSKGLFVVRGRKIYDETDTTSFKADKVMSSSGETRTTIITCHGERKQGGGYPQRVVLVFEAVEHVSASGEKLSVIGELKE